MRARLGDEDPEKERRDLSKSEGDVQSFLFFLFAFPPLSKLTCQFIYSSKCQVQCLVLGVGKNLVVEVNNHRTRQPYSYSGLTGQHRGAPLTGTPAPGKVIGQVLLYTLSRLEINTSPIYSFYSGDDDMEL